MARCERQCTETEHSLCEPVLQLLHLGCLLAKLCLSQTPLVLGVVKHFLVVLYTAFLVLKLIHKNLRF